MQKQQQKQHINSAGKLVKCEATVRACKYTDYTEDEVEDLKTRIDRLFKATSGDEQEQYAKLESENFVNIPESRTVLRLLSSGELTVEQREKMLSNLPEDLFIGSDIVDGQMNKGALLSFNEYQIIVNSKNNENYLPVIAKNHELLFSQRKKLLQDDPWGLSLLAMHNPDKFYEDEELVNKLVDNIDNNVEDKYGTALSALAMSPHKHHQEKIINHPDLFSDKTVQRNSPHWGVYELTHNSKADASTLLKLLRKQDENNFPGYQTVTALQNLERLTEEEKTKLHKIINKQPYIRPKGYKTPEFYHTKYSETHKNRQETNSYGLEYTAMFYAGRAWANDKDYKTLQNVIKQTEKTDHKGKPGPTKFTLYELKFFHNAATLERETAHYRIKYARV